jgi:hypothetical protein
VIIELEPTVSNVSARPKFCESHWGSGRAAVGRLRINDTVHYLCDARLSRVEEAIRSR